MASGGRLIVFEGGEGSGKSTQIRRLSASERCHESGVFVRSSNATCSGYSVAPVCVSEPLSQLGTIFATTGSTTDMKTIGIDLSVTTRIDDCATGVVTATIIAGFLPCAFVSSWGISVRSKLMCWSSNATSLPSTKPWRTTSALKPLTAARNAGCSPKLAMAISFGCASAGKEASSAMKARAARSDMKRLPG